MEWRAEYFIRVELAAREARRGALGPAADPRYDALR